MRITLLLVFSATLGFLVEPVSTADEASHRAAIEKLFSTMNMEKAHSASLENILQQQARANPAMAQLQGTMRDFLNKYMGWATLKDDMIKIYQGAYTESEIGELNKFYETPVGKKSIEQMPVLMGKGMAVAQERMKEHLPELQAALKAAAEKQTGVKQVIPPTK